jgi:hypothetical protein
VTPGYNVDTKCYTDTCATDHITSELNKLTMREKYGGTDQVHATNGLGMPISHIGHSTIHTHGHVLILKDILHLPDAFKNLVWVHKFTYDNNTFFEFHPWYFLLKDQGTRNLLLQGRCRNHMHPLPLAALTSHQYPNKSVLAAVKPTLVRWHHRLGHGLAPIV